MSTDNINSVESTPEFQDDLDLFSKDFFGQNDPAPDKESANSEDQENEEVEVKEDRDASNEEDVDSEVDTDEDEKDDEEEEVEEKPKPRKNRAQERINELTKQAREAERRVEEYAQKLKQIEEAQEAKPEKVDAVTQGPDPEDKNEDGTDKYPLGEFDPSYIRDLTKFTLAEERKALQAEEAKKKEEAEAQEFKQKLNESWNQKLAPAQERYPDFHEKGENLDPVFESIDQRYAEYLAATIMEMDHGPDVLYYLAGNVDEAHKIVGMGPTKATIALGRIEAKFADHEQEKAKARPKLSKAPTPPEHLNKGSAAAVIEPEDDTDDLDAFAKKFFTKKRRY